jgi:hypothetical protein
MNIIINEINEIKMPVRVIVLAYEKRPIKNMKNDKYFNFNSNLSLVLINKRAKNDILRAKNDPTIVADSALSGLQINLMFLEDINPFSMTLIIFDKNGIKQNRIVKEKIIKYVILMSGYLFEKYLPIA